MLTNFKSIPISEIYKLTGFLPDDILAECKKRAIAPIHMGNNYYLTADMIQVLFSQDGADNFVTYQPNYSTALDSRPTAELSFSQRYDKEVKRVANATISFVSKEGRKKPYLVQWRVYLEDGSYKRVSKCFATREEAERYAAEVNDKREQSCSCSESVHIETTENGRQALGLSDYSAMIGTGIEGAQAVGGNMSFYDYMLYYIKDSGKCNCKDRTKKCYVYAAASVRLELEKIGAGDVTLEGLSDTMLNKVFNEMAQNIRQSTLNKSFNFVKRTLKYAFKKKYISENIADLLDKSKSQLQPEEREPYTDEEIEMILGAAKPNTRLYAFISIALYTGMRPSEIRVLRWSDIDWDSGTIHVNGAAKRKYDDLEHSTYTEYVGDTKSKSGIRVIALAESAAAALRAWRTASEQDSVGKDSEFVFFDEDGGFMKEEAFTSMWGRFIKSHGWKGKKYFVYRFRHTFCTRLLLSGCTPQMVQALMGDSTLNVIMRIYNGIKSKDVIEVTRDSVNGIYGAA
ncbi:MAG: site-specific integrase [Ruminococcus sp.]|nr:site-specific integrase [Ruminococcus sp.]